MRYDCDGGSPPRATFCCHFEQRCMHLSHVILSSATSSEARRRRTPIFSREPSQRLDGSRKIWGPFDCARHSRAAQGDIKGERWPEEDGVLNASGSRNVKTSKLRNEAKSGIGEEIIEVFGHRRDGNRTTNVIRGRKKIGARSTARGTAAPLRVT